MRSPDARSFCPSCRWWVAALVFAFGLDATAGTFRLFKTPTERRIEEVRRARKRADLDTAAKLLDALEASLSQPVAAARYERGLLLQQTRQSEKAVGVLREAANLDPSSGARVDLAAVLVELGRWPEAVVELRRTFTERGASLDVDDVLAEPRFAPLLEFAPYKELISQARNEQAGPLGRLRARLEAIESSARALQDTIDRVRQMVALVSKVFESPWLPVVILVLLVFLISSGLGHMKILPPPWTVVVATGIGCALWAMVVRVMTTGERSAGDTVGIAAAFVLLPTGVAALMRWKRRREAETADQPMLPAADAPALPQPGALEPAPRHRQLPGAHDPTAPPVVATTEQQPPSEKKTATRKKRTRRAEPPADA